MKGSGLFKQKIGLLKARTFSNIFSIIDDLCNFIHDEFENNYSDIFLDLLELKKETPCKASDLDLSIEIHDKKIL